MSGMQKPNLNKATQKQLQAVPQIGPKLSEALVAGAPFLDWEAVQRIPGIGEKRLASLQSQFSIPRMQTSRTPLSSQPLPNSGYVSPAWVDPTQTPPPSNTDWELISMTPNTSDACRKSGEPGTPNLNTVSEEDLQKVPGIGPKIAAALCHSRPFITWDDVEKVPLVGRKRLQALQSMLSLGPEPDAPVDAKDQSHGLHTVASAGTLRQCYLPETVFRGLDGQPIRVYELQKGNFVCGADGTQTEVTHCQMLPKGPRDIVILQAGEIELRVLGVSRIAVQRGAKKASAPASCLKKGEDVFCTGDEVKQLTEVQHGMRHVEVYEIEFTDKDVEAFTLQQLPQKTILARPRSTTGTRRSGVANRSKQPAARTPSPVQRMY